jgi:GR25 family glycosyltransferase involved in LPS biosynthesis
MINNINTYCINLDHRTDKWEQVQEEAKKLGVDLIRFSAFKERRGHDGCRKSHLSILNELKNEPMFMLTEDDFKIIVDDPIDLVNKAVSQLPADWDMLYLGATLTQPIDRYSENLYRIKRAWATHAIIYNNQNGVVEYILQNHNTQKFSVFLCDDVQLKFNCYITYPMVATQRAGHSDILRHHVTYEGIEQRYKKYAGK